VNPPLGAASDQLPQLSVHSLFFAWQVTESGVSLTTPVASTIDNDAELDSVGVLVPTRHWYPVTGEFPSLTGSVKDTATALPAVPEIATAMF
jgi:hypothetical protein